MPFSYYDCNRQNQSKLEDENKTQFFLYMCRKYWFYLLQNLVDLSTKSESECGTYTSVYP